MSPYFVVSSFLDHPGLRKSGAGEPKAYLVCVDAQAVKSIFFLYDP